MIPENYILAWQRQAPWSDYGQVEQDLLLSRALFQRNKGRDLFDLWLAADRNLADPGRLVESFLRYTAHLDPAVSRARMEKNLSAKFRDPQFRADISPLLRGGEDYDIDRAFMTIHERYVAVLPGEPYAGEDNIFARSRRERD